MEYGLNLFALSLTQKDIYLSQLHHSDSPLYNIGGYVRCGAPDIDRISRAHQKVVLNHDAFGIRIVHNGDDVQQTISQQRNEALPVIDFSTQANPGQAAMQWLDSWFQTPMPYHNSELCHTRLLKISEDQYWYAGLSHHLAMDGWGFSNWAYQLAHYYNNNDGSNYNNNDGSNNDKTAVSWQDITLKDQQYVDSTRYQNDKTFWLEQCKSLSIEQPSEKLLTPHYLSAVDHQQDNNKAMTSSRHRMILSRSTLNHLTQAAQTMGAGVPQLFLGMLTTYFALAHQRDSIVFGAPAHNRKNFAEKKTLGVFTSVSPLVVNINPSASFTTLVQHIGALQKAAFRHQRFPVGHIMQALGQGGDDQLLYDVSFNYLKPGYAALAFDGINADVVYHHHHADQVPLTVTLWDGGGDNIELQLDYHHAYYRAEEIQLLANRFEHLLTLLTTPSTATTPLADLPLLPSAEIDLLCHQLQSNPVDYQQNQQDQQLVHQMFEAQVQRTPDAVAVECDDEVLSYLELNNRANQLGHYLRENGVQVEDLVGLCLHRSTDMLVALLAILKAGGAYVALDPQYPQTRINTIVKDSGLKVLITRSNQTTRFEAEQVSGIIELDTIEPMLANYSPDNLPPSSTQTADKLAYLIYTSGSTGKPKGVMIEHRNTVAFLHWARGYFSFEEMRCVLASTSLNFDLSVFELLAPLSCGGRCLIVDNILALTKSQINPRYKGISLINTVPSGITAVLKENAVPDSVVTINLAGEALRRSLVNELHNTLDLQRVVNLYGPSEDTTYSTVMAMNEAVNGAVLIGKPIHNTQAYVLTPKGQLAPMGITGELYLAGDGLARGYHNQPDVTAAAFITDISLTNKTKRLYKTGDLVRYLPEGQLAYLGRSDDQVKIRGFRVEPGEIEHQLTQCDGVELAVVVALPDPSGQQRLVAYIQPQQPQQAIADKAQSTTSWVAMLRQRLQDKLPQYMVPAAFVVITKWPQTANGKIDKKALPTPDESLLQGEYIAAQTPTEQTLVSIWAALLGLDEAKLSVTANFFAVGGDSLLLMRLVAQVRQTMGRELPLEKVFDAQDIRRQAALLEQNTGLLRTTVTAIDYSTSNDTATLSFAQQRMWFIDKIQGSSGQYNMPGVFALKGHLDLKAAEQAFSQLIERHQILHTVYLDDAIQAKPQLLQDFDFNLITHDLTSLTASDKAAKSQQIINAHSQQPFNLSADLMFRASYIVLDQNEGILLLNMHHIASDGWSVKILLQEFATLYQAGDLTPLTLQYSDYAHWQKNWLQGDVLQSQLDYWQQHLAELPPVHGLLLDKPRPAVKQHIGASVTGQLPPDVADGLQQLAVKHQLTPFMLLHGALALMLARHSNSTDIVIGTPVANRLQAELEPLVGCFVNTLVLRVDTSHQQLNDYLQHIRQVHLNAQSHQDVPFEQLVEQLNIPRSTAYDPLFQIMLTTGSDAMALDLPGLDLSVLPAKVVTAKFDLDIDISFNDNGIRLNWTFDTGLFNPEHIEQFNDHLCRLLTELTTAQAETNPNQLAMLSPQEQDHLLNQLNSNSLDYAKDRCIHQLFEAQVKATPTKIALSCEGHQLSYGELNQRANQLAHYLVEQHQLKPDTLVGLSLKRSVDMVVGLLGILKAGGAYVPLDPDYPSARLDTIKQEAQLTLVLTQASINPSLFEHLPQHNPDTKAQGLTAEHLAYVIYTSGSTGKPKGVAIRHRNTSAMLHWANNTFSAAELDKVLASTSLNFDLSVFELFVPLCFGYQCVLVKDASALLQHQPDISLLNTVPSVIEALLAQDAVPAGVKTINLAGEPLSAKIVNQILTDRPGTTVRNLYGPSEDTTYSTHMAFTEVVNHEPPIGKVIANSQGLVLTEAMTLTPPGVTGQLYLSGDGVAKGYLNQPQLTAERFINNPYYDPANPHSSQVLYQTGDLVRYLPDEQGRPDNLAYMGRMDDQVKIRGFRIELGEIQYQLSVCVGVNTSLVMVREDQPGEPRLVAYVMADNDHLLTPQLTPQLTPKLAEQLQKTLPHYMIPTAFVLIDQWPLTANGKIDKKALPAPEPVVLSQTIVAADNELEVRLVKLISELLQQPQSRISTTTSFFDFGLNSLKLFSVVNLINREFDVTLAATDLYKKSTIQLLAAHINTSCLMSQLAAATDDEELFEEDGEI